MSLEPVNPLDIPNWDDLVLATGEASIFHSAAWARVLHESYGYKPVYFASFENGKLTSLMPFMEVDSWLTGKRGVSLPFSDRIKFLGAHGSSLSEVIPQVIDYGKKSGWRYAEWRDGRRLPEGETSTAIFYIHILHFDRDLTKIFSGFSPSTRRNIRRAGREGVNVEVVGSSEALKAFYRLHCMTRKSHGFPPQPYNFFEKILKHIILAHKGFLVLATFEKRPVAGAVFFYFGDTVVFKYGASDRRYHHLRPNNLVLWEAIKWCEEKSFRYLDFGRTKPGDKGLLRFKAGWGTKSQPVSYYKYDLRKRAFLGDGDTWEWAQRFAGKLPLPIFNLVGSLLYRHVG